MDNNKIGKFIASMRKEKRLTQKELGDKLYVTDKAVSKWERGISLPDITLLRKMADLFDVEVEDILAGEKVNLKNKNDIENKVKEIQEKLKLQNKKKKIKVVFCFIILILLLVYIIFKNFSFGYYKKDVYYQHVNRNINIGIPRLSFMIKNNDRSYTMKNFRSANIIENETKKYLKTLKYLSCNDTIYYYDEDNNISIIDYKIKNKFIYSTLSYEIVENDYCLVKKIDEYSRKLHGLKKFHFYGDGVIHLNEKGDKLVISFVDGINYESNRNELYSFKAEMKVYFYKKVETLKDSGKAYRITLEDSIGSIEIKDNKLYYYREKINDNNQITVPEVSIFNIDKNGDLILTDNYLSKYAEEILLKG